MEKQKIRKGIIRGFSGSWGSGLAFLQIQDSETGIVQNVPCENGATVRALEGAFGNVIGKAHNVKQDAGFLGQEIFWSLADYGVMEGFMPVDLATSDFFELYEKQQKEKKC